MTNTKKRIRITSLNSLKKLLSKLMNDVFFDRIETEKTETLIKICNTYINVFKVENQQKAINKTETVTIELTQQEINEKLKNLQSIVFD